MPLSKKVLRVHNQNVKQTNRPTMYRTDFVWPNQSGDEGVPILQDSPTRFYLASGITLQLTDRPPNKRNSISGEKHV